MWKNRGTLQPYFQALAATTILVCLNTAHAQIMRGNDLQKWLNSYANFESGAKTEDNYTNSMIALHYITGVAESYKNTGLLCFPNSVTAGQLTAIVAKYVRANPEKWNKHANILTFEALSTPFACLDNDKK